ncbi:hypothetical protein REPUB_Repub02eG0177500 [Reevesia pubescens]
MIQWLSGAVTTLNQSSFDKGMVLSWAIWGSRNDDVKNNIKSSPARFQPMHCICEAERMGGSRVIIRDEEGSVLGACSVTHLGLQSPKIVEASAALNTLTFAADMGF